MPNRLGEGRDLPGGQIAGQDRKRASCNGVTAQPGHQPAAPGRPHQHRRCQPPPRPRPPADTQAARDRMNDFAGSLGSFPARDMIRDWLKAGVFEAGKGFAPTEEGTPQGGIISPCLLNVALHGLEEAAGVTYVTSGKHAGETRRGSPALIRYADDLVALCHSREQAEQVKARPADWLVPKGLAFNEDK